VTTLVGDMSSNLVLPVNSASIIPEGFELYQNYPNPFNPTTIIRYSIPEATKIKLEIYNVLGQKVKTIVNEFKKPGNYEVSLNASNYASGVYFYRIKSSKFNKVKKMILIK
jgi:hypothetical protein